LRREDAIETEVLRGYEEPMSIGAMPTKLMKRKKALLSSEKICSLRTDNE
jgi:hypothetical protein